MCEPITTGFERVGDLHSAASRTAGREPARSRHPVPSSFRPPSVHLPGVGGRGWVLVPVVWTSHRVSRRLHVAKRKAASAARIHGDDLT